jgi:hypothetical protein
MQCIDAALFKQFDSVLNLTKRKVPSADNHYELKSMNASHPVGEGKVGRFHRDVDSCHAERDMLHDSPPQTQQGLANVLMHT